MGVDVELESWRRSWHAAPAAVPDLRERVERETRTMRRFLVGEVIITVVFCGGTLAWTLLSRRTDALIFAIGVWFFTAVAWTLSYLLRRDAWAPAALTASAFLDLSILRCRRRYEAIVAQSILYVLILTFDLWWIYVGRADRTGVLAFLTSPGIAWVWLVTAALGLVALRQRRRLARELEHLGAMRREFDRAASS
jgi:hypothetical protein